MEAHTRAQLLTQLVELKSQHKKLKKTKNLIDELDKQNSLELEQIKMSLRFIDVSDVLRKDNYKLMSLRKDNNGLYSIEYQIIRDGLVDTSKTFKMLWNNYKYYGCRQENAKIKEYENVIYEQLVTLFTSNNIKKQVKLDGLKLTRPLFIDFSVKINDETTIYIEVDENVRHWKSKDIQFERDNIKDAYIKDHNLKLLRIDPVDLDLTDTLLNEYIDKLLNSTDNVLKFGKRYE